MRVAEVMSRGVDLLPPDATVQEAATRMAEDDVGAVLVGEGNALAGVLTDRDILVRAVVQGRDTTCLPVREIMSSRVYTCREADTLEAAFHEMRERQVRRLPVLDAGGALTGVVTMSDLGKRERDPRRASEALREIAEPHRRRQAEGKSETAAGVETDALDRGDADGDAA
jgi:CBS domain-containing protein